MTRELDKLFEKLGKQSKMATMEPAEVKVYLYLFHLMGGISSFGDACLNDSGLVSHIKYLGCTKAL